MADPILSADSRRAALNQARVILAQPDPAKESKRVALNESRIWGMILDWTNSSNTKILKTTQDSVCVPMRMVRDGTVAQWERDLREKGYLTERSPTAFTVRLPA